MTAKTAPVRGFKNNAIMTPTKLLLFNRPTKINVKYTGYRFHFYKVLMDHPNTI